jgi:hypothetical protein
MIKRAVAAFRKVWPFLRWGLLVLVLVVVWAAMATGLRAGYTQENTWTGFRDYQPKIGEPERGKTLWDWLDLLIIPAVLAVGAYLVNRNSQRNDQRRADRENAIEREIASERNQEAALQTYLDRMTELLLEKDLRKSDPKDEVRTVARTRTLTVLRGLNGERKGTVVQFLIEAGLVVDPISQGENAKLIQPIVSLAGADLNGANLRGANLSNADLRNTLLCRADLTEADLTGARLAGARMVSANLRDTNLHGAKLPNGRTWSVATDMDQFTKSPVAKGRW